MGRRDNCMQTDMIIKTLGCSYEWNKRATTWKYENQVVGCPCEWHEQTTTCRYEDQDVGVSLWMGQKEGQALSLRRNHTLLPSGCHARSKSKWKIQTLKLNTRIAHNVFSLGISISIIHRCNESIWWPSINWKELTWGRSEVPYQHDKKLSQNKRTHSQLNKAAKCCGIKHALNSSVLRPRLRGKYLTSIIFTLTTF